MGDASNAMANGIAMAAVAIEHLAQITFIKVPCKL